MSKRAAGADPQAAMPPVPVTLMLALAFKSGAARGRHTIKLRTETPIGTRVAEVGLPVLFEGEDRGVNVFANFNMVAEQEGLYWIEVLLDEVEDPVTRIPLRI